jgi:AcrR family transcriptional regulator
MLGGGRSTRKTLSQRNEEPWPYFRYQRPLPRSGKGGREARIAGHVQKHKERGARPPGRDRGLSLDEIVSAAIAVADAEGPDAVSMRRIAREVNAGAMSLYWYVGSKEELLDRMLDRIEGEIEVPDPSGDWRGDLNAFAYQTRAALTRHRWAAEFIGSRPPTGPNDVRNLERLLGLIDGSGAEDDVQLVFGVFNTVATFVMGAVMREAQEIRFQDEQDRLEAGMTPEEREEHERLFREWISDAGQFPRIARMVHSGIDPDSPETRDQRFQFGLDCVLDGIGARLAASHGSAPPAPPAPDRASHGSPLPAPPAPDGFPALPDLLPGTPPPLAPEAPREAPPEAGSPPGPQAAPAAP